MVRDELSDAKLREAKRRANWTMPLEHYWPPELLAQAFPGRFGHLVAKPHPQQEATGMAPAQPAESSTYTVEPVSGGCHVIRPQFGGYAGTRLLEPKA